MIHDRADARNPFHYTVVPMSMSISKIKNRIRRDIQIIDDPDDVANLLDIFAGTLRKQFRHEEHDRLWMFILKEKVTHFLENLPPYPTGGNGQFPNAGKVIDSYRSVLPGPDRTWLREARDMIALINDNPFDSNLNVSWIRNELNIPSRMYTQKFYYFTRMHVTEYIRWHRLVMAKYLLSHSSLKIRRYCPAGWIQLAFRFLQGVCSACRLFSDETSNNPSGLLGSGCFPIRSRRRV